MYYHWEIRLIDHIYTMLLGAGWIFQNTFLICCRIYCCNILQCHVMSFGRAKHQIYHMLTKKSHFCHWHWNHNIVTTTIEIVILALTNSLYKSLKNTRVFPCVCKNSIRRFHCCHYCCFNMFQQIMYYHCEIRQIYHICTMVLRTTSLYYNSKRL